ncbi:integrase core domain-containing protein, partial [Corynebacterium flavescens]|uniref:integrase core domain-containing protein n=2 Tax=Corynebacterium flavescens TaxID=28028 RepID=UPI002648A664
SYHRPKNLVLRPPIESAVYTSSAFQTTCRRLGIRQSMGRIGSSADNAMAESFNASLKRETLQGSGGWASPVQCRREVFRWITRYNTRRRHSGISYLSPRAFEHRATAVTVAPAA